jgi:DNA-binding IclR family transcriptional regulator
MEKPNSQERVLIIVEKLTEHSVEGLSNKQIAFELKAPEPNICRDLGILERQGWVEKSKANGKWRLTPKFGGFAGGIIKCFQSAKLRLTADEARYASEMQ